MNYCYIYLDLLNNSSDELLLQISIADICCRYVADLLQKWALPGCSVVLVEKLFQKRLKTKMPKEPVYCENQTVFHPDYCGNKKFMNNKILVWNER